LFTLSEHTWPGVSLEQPFSKEPVMRTERIAACLTALILALGAIVIAATITLSTGHSVWKGHTLTRDVSTGSATTLQLPSSTYYDD